MGPHFVIDLVKQQTQQLSKAARDARGPLRTAIVDLAFQYHEFLGWLQQDAGHYGDAMVSTDRARDLASELNDPLWLAYLLMRKSNIATDADDPSLATSLVEAALSVTSKLTPRLHAIVLRQKANAHVSLGNSRECAAAISDAFEVIDRQNDDTKLAVYCTSPYVAMEASHCWTQLGRPDLAVDAFELARTEWPQGLRRDQGLALARLSSACAGIGDVDRACATGRDAVALATVTGSARTVRELRLLRAQLAPWNGDPQVVSLSAAVASLVATAA